MTSYLIANLLGRLFASYAIVWLIMLVASRVDWREAFKRTHRWCGFLGVFVVFVLGLAGTYLKQSA